MWPSTVSTLPIQGMRPREKHTTTALAPQDPKVPVIVRVVIGLYVCRGQNGCHKLRELSPCTDVLYYCSLASLRMSRTTRLRLSFAGSREYGLFSQIRRLGVGSSSVDGATHLSVLPSKSWQNLGIISSEHGSGNTFLPLSKSWHRPPFCRLIVLSIGPSCCTATVCAR